MTDTTNYFKLGLFVVIGLVIALGTLVWLGYRQLQQDYFEVHAYFDEPVDGLEIGSPVKFRGVPIGQVADIVIAEDKKHVHVTAHIFVGRLVEKGLRSPDEKEPPAASREARELLGQLRVQVVTSFLTGVSFLQTDVPTPGRHPHQELPFAPEEPFIEAIPSALRTLEQGLLDSLAAIPELREDAESLMAELEKGLGDLQLRALSDETQKLLSTFEERIAGIEETGFVTEGTVAFQRVSEAAVEVEELVAELRRPDGPLRRLVDRLDTELEGVDLGAASAALRGAGEEVAGLGSELRAEVRLLHRTLDAIRRLADLLERDPGALLRGRATPRRPEDR